ncbi:MAG TPA: EAL domain-containing protein [Xanthobacteraceae bacterium]|nr:EAL domain-containing protein [Xanthobacteraceae bacterium]
MNKNKGRDSGAASILAFPSAAAAAVAGRKNSEQKEYLTLLDTVLSNMSQGVLLFDAEARLVFCNQRYIEMYGLSPEIVVPGCRLGDLLAHRKAVGTFCGDTDVYMAEVAELAAQGKNSTGTAKAADGRVFSIIRTPVSGGGWIATHEDITERQRAEERIVHMARHDALTDLPNRTMLRERLEYELRRVKRGEGLAMLCLDLDHFKSVNDTLGHPIGDELLKVVAERLRGCTRAPDTIARLGGDEFAIVMTGMNDPADAAALAKRIRESITRPYYIDGHQILADISIGISVAPVDAVEPDLLLKNADMALYGAKADGRGTYRFFEPEMDARMKARRELDMDLRKAMVKDEFELYYQPLVNLQDNRITAFEALLRWNHPVRGLISPADFIPIAEETGLIVPLGEWVLRRACLETSKWPADIKVAVNLSPSQLKSRNLTDVVMDALETSGMPAKRLQLEITETVLMQNTFNTLATLEKLRALGVQIALDDFGTGYSSLSYLRSFPFDKIKIDRSFIQDLSNGTEPLAIVHAVAGLAKSLNMISTAEGVETRQQLETLQSVGCVEMQGYLFSKARPPGEIERMFLQGDRRVAAT